ncbi:apolipoprotein A-IV-like [Antennarius striatus]|uniref:apolipoprotein A-IV-like n=1 Tax=Antennarius striatus TaxID=241820 RepID=UPI0035AF096D
MKVLVVLVLAVFTAGCNANIVRQKQPKQPTQKADMVTDAFWDWVAMATATAKDSLNQVRDSQLGKEMNTLISESTDAVNKLSVALLTQVAPLTPDLVSKFSQEAESLKIRLEKDLTTVGARMQPFAEAMVADLQVQVEELKGIAPYANTMDPEALKATLLQKSQELKEQLDHGMKMLQVEMIPYSEEIMEKIEQSLDEFQTSMIPMIQSFETKLTQKTQQIQRRLVPIGEDLKANLEANTQKLKRRLNSLWSAFTKLTQ